MIALVRRVLVAAVLAACAVSAVAAVSLPARGRTLVAWTAPHGRPAGVVLVLHGGAWRAAGPPTMALMDTRARAFAGWGWAAAVVDYRAFADAPGDVVRAYDAARARFPGLPICAYGESAGGQLALMLAVRRPLACVIDAAGPVDLPRLDGTPQADWVRAKALAAFGDLRDASPTHHAAAIRAPVLAGYGAADRIVPASQGRYLKRALTHARVIELATGAGPRFVHAPVAAAALRGWWSAVRAQLQRAARPRT
jgi:dipeptidyl aminopeptidase/acylaminoacyl peptidase